MKQKSGTVNEFGIHNTKGETLTREYIAEYVSGYCRPIEQFSHNRKANMEFFKSNQFLSRFQNQLVSEVAKAAKTDKCWGMIPAEQVSTQSFPQTAQYPAFQAIAQRVTVVPTQTANILFNGQFLKPEQVLRIAEQEIKFLASRILSDFGISNYRISFSSGKGAKHVGERNFRPGSPHKFIFGSQSTMRYASKEYTEYPSLSYMIRAYKTTGIHGVRLLVIHEVAHALVAEMGQRTPGDCHGRNFQSIYSQLLAAYAERK
jgi:hypothetical protein